MTEPQTPAPEPTESQPPAAPPEPTAAAPEPTAPEPVIPAVHDTPDAPPPAPEPVAPAPTAEPIAPAPATMPRPAATPPDKGGIHWGLGRRKSSVARVRLLPGDGKILINKRELESYFTQTQDRNAVTAPLEATESRRMWDMMVNVRGGGPSGQSGAIRLGLARALVSINESLEATLRDAGYLTRDARRVERKKFGRRKARRGFQFSKR